MGSRSLNIPSTLRAKIHHYMSTKNINAQQFADRCGLSYTVIIRIVRAERSVYSGYSAKRINQVLNNGEDFSGKPRQERLNVSVGALTPIPAWIIPALRDFVESVGTQSHAGKRIGVDGSLLGKVIGGGQSQMRAENLSKIVAFFKGKDGSPAAKYKISGDSFVKTPVPSKKSQPELPLGVHAAEMNLIHDAFNHWTDEQREAFGNLAHAFKRRDEDSAALKNVGALAVALRKIFALEASLSEAEASATKWEHEYLKLKQKVEALTG